MIVINARITADPETIRTLQPAIAAMETASRAEPGCEDYCFSVELNDPGVLRITERWRDMAALIAHFATPHMTRFGAALGAHPPKSVEARCYEANEVPLPGR
ncbi:MAG: antibiotic biosynthesis monooxygenase [Pseudomonadales bacterium]|nr:antibiotic biosynthesis monooxygenase [Pseudomonadales bacterium]